MPKRKGAVQAGAAVRDPTVLREADEMLAHIRTLWRDLLRSPFDEAEAHGLTGPQVTVMATLVSRGSMTLTELSRALGMSHSTASGIVDRLQARGLVRRSRDDTDRRRTGIEVTEKVTRYVRELEAGPSGRLAAALAALSATDREAIIAGFRTLREQLDRSGRSRATRRAQSRRN